MGESISKDLEAVPNLSRRRRMTLRPWIAWAALVAIGLPALAAWWTGIVALTHETGYFGPVFAPDGKTVVAVSRDARAFVTGFGREFFTTPATVRVHRDRFRLIQIDAADGRVTVLDELPPSPLEGSKIRAYHGAIFGTAHARVRWMDADRLEYEAAVTRHDTPLARTFVIRKVWSRKPQADATTAASWQERPAQLSSDESQQLSGDLEAIAVPGDEMMPCAIALLRRDGTATPLVQTAACRRKYEAGISPAILAPLSRRANIERAGTIRTTYADLVQRGRRAGRSEGEAMLDANKEMRRLGLYPKTTTIVAARAGCDAASPQFDISDDELRFGLFSDIDAAIATPGAEVDKSIGAYITHRDYTTSRQINEYLDAGHASFLVRARGGCWRMIVRRP